MQGVEGKVAAIARGRRAERQTATAPRPPRTAPKAATSPAEVPAHVTAKLRELVRRVPPSQRAGYARRMLMVWQAQGTDQVVTASDKAESRASLALVIALDEAGAFDG